MNGDCGPRGRDEWPGTRGGNGGETRARREPVHERKDPRTKEGEENEGEGEGVAGRGEKETVFA